MISYIARKRSKYREPSAPVSQVNAPVVIGDFINDPFDGGSLVGWTVPAGQTVTVSGGKAQVVGTGSAKNVARRIINTGWGQSTLRNFYTEVDFKINLIGANTKGAFVGVESAGNTDALFSVYAFLDFSTGNNAFQLVACDQFGAIIQTLATSAELPAINTADTYRMRLTLQEGTVSATLLNVASGISATPISYTYNMLTGAPLRPNIFYYAYGCAGNSDVNFNIYKGHTQEKRYPKIVFIGDSITTGYSSGDALLAYPYLLRSKTAGDIQIMAGGGNNILNTLDNLKEILYVKPEYAFINIGTNNGGSFSDFLKLNLLIQEAGIKTIQQSVVNKGDPFTPGTWNYKMRSSFPNTFTDLYSPPGQSVMFANGFGYDELHPNAAGEEIYADLIYEQWNTVIFEL